MLAGDADDQAQVGAQDLVARIGDPAEMRFQRIQIAAERPAAGADPLVRQTAYVVPRAHKAAALGRILDVESPAAAIVFCRTRVEVDELTQTLNGRGCISIKVISPLR